jgi:hypothetical protein
VSQETMLTRLLELLDAGCVRRILDAGSGRTSLSVLCRIFPGAAIDAIVYPGDERKKQSIRTSSLNMKKVMVLEQDLCVWRNAPTYDLIVAHLLLGEATKFGHTLQELLYGLLNIPGDRLLIVDYPDDPDIDVNLIHCILSENGWETTAGYLADNEEPPTFDGFTAYRSFGGLYTRATRSFMIS